MKARKSCAVVFFSIPILIFKILQRHINCFNFQFDIFSMFSKSSLCYRNCPFWYGPSGISAIFPCKDFKKKKNNKIISSFSLKFLPFLDDFSKFPINFDAIHSQKSQMGQKSVRKWRKNIIITNVGYDLETTFQNIFLKHFLAIRVRWSASSRICWKGKKICYRVRRNSRWWAIVHFVLSRWCTLYFGQIGCSLLSWISH